MRISDERSEEALKYLLRTDYQAAELKAAVERTEFKAKAIRDAMIARLEGPAAKCSAQAGSSPEYATAMGEYFAALSAFERVRNKRNTESIVIECWRTTSANLRKGNV